MRDPLITEALFVLREYQAELRAQGREAEALAGDVYIRRLETRYPAVCVKRHVPPLLDRRRR